MHDIRVIVAKQRAAVQKEYDDAIDRGDIELANRIYAANPDITPLWQENQNPDKPSPEPDTPWEDDWDVGGEA